MLGTENSLALSINVTTERDGFSLAHMFIKHIYMHFMEFIAEFLIPRPVGWNVEFWGLSILALCLCIFFFYSQPTCFCLHRGIS